MSVHIDITNSSSVSETARRAWNQFFLMVRYPLLTRAWNHRKAMPPA
jgi:hypothetical protein